MNTLISQPTSFFRSIGLGIQMETFCSFRSHNKLIKLERKYSHAKDWERKFFFVSRVSWEFPANETLNQEFLVRACWSPVSSEHDFEILLSPLEEARIQLV